MSHFDVLIVGAGISGIGAAYHLQSLCPGKSYAILEGRSTLGGTWDLFRYPGIRSDSDMHTLGYAFRPWTSRKSIADGPSILKYLRETAEAYGIDRRIRYGCRVRHASWSGEQARWRVEYEDAGSGERVHLTCNFLLMCTGYYRYDRGYMPSFVGMERFRGRLVHPQHWPEDLDYAGKRVVVIGSGATAVTLVPAMSEKAAHVTMLQRSPSYVVAIPGEDRIAQWLRQRLSPERAHAATRWKNILLSVAFYQFSRRFPERAKRWFIEGVRHRLGADFDVETHFTPSYDPWDQRVCLVPDGDLFDALNRGDASVVTDEIERFTERGVKLRSGRELEADVVVTATGLELLYLGGVELCVDGEHMDPAERRLYKGMMLSDVPNMVATIGYTNASWTLRCDLVSRYACRLMQEMDRRGADQCCARDPGSAEPVRPLLDLTSGYVMRAADRMPKQGARAPWRVYQNYLLDLVAMHPLRLEDRAMTFSTAASVRRERSGADACAGGLDVETH